jgi:hypothetical protein
MRRPTGRRALLLAGAVIALAIVFAVALYRVSGVAADLSDASDALRSAEAHVRDGEIGAARTELAKAEGLVAAANGTLRTSPDLALVRLLPVARQNIDALTRSVGIGLVLTNGGRQVLDAASSLQGPGGRLEVPLRGGAVPLEAVAESSAALKDVAFALPGDDRPGGRWLIGPVKDLQDEVYDEAARRRRQFVSVAWGLDILRELSGGNGPRRYFLAVANAAEMRGTGGMILSYGALTSQDGKIALERFGGIDELELDASVDVTEPADYLARFASFAPNRLWRNTNLGSDFTFVAPMFEKMYPAATGQPVDGVIQIDSVGLAAVLEGIGPVETPEVGRVEAGNAVALTLNEAYVRFPDRPVRQEYLESVARTVFDRLLTGDYPSVTALARALANAAAGRHIIVHSTNPESERAVARLGADGSLPGPGTDFAQLTVQNFSGNKLDFYLDTKLTLTGQRRPGRLDHVRAVVEVANTAPPNGRPPYIFGPFSSDLALGQYKGLATVYLPPGASLGGPATGVVAGPPAVSAEAGRTAVSFTVDVPAGGTQTVVLDLELPPTPGVDNRWVLIPTPRVRPTSVALDIRTPHGRLQFAGPLERRTDVRAAGG